MSEKINAELILLAETRGQMKDCSNNQNIQKVIKQMRQDGVKGRIEVKKTNKIPDNLAATTYILPAADLRKLKPIPMQVVV